MNNKIICECFNVSVEDVRNVIKNGADSFEEIQKVTQVASGCGECLSDVKRIIQSLLNECEE